MNTNKSHIDPSTNDSHDSGEIDAMLGDFFSNQSSEIQEVVITEVSSNESPAESPRVMSRQPIDDQSDLQTEVQIESSKKNMAGFESLTELVRLGKTKGAYARLEAYLDKIPAENRDLIKSIMLEFDFQPNDPEMVMMMLWTHFVAAGRTLNTALDAATSDAVERLTNVVATADSIPEAAREVLHDARKLHTEFLEESQNQTAAIAERVAEAMRESTIALAERTTDLIDQAKQQALNEISAQTKQTEAHIATITAAALQTLNTLPQSLADTVKQELVKSATPARDRLSSRLTSSTFLLGAGLGIVITAIAFSILH